MRLFVGLGVADAQRAPLERVVGALRQPDDGLRWHDPASWHVTLKFLGEVGATQYVCVVEALREVRGAAVPARLTGLGQFARAGVLLAEVEASPELVELQRRVEEAVAGCVFAVEERPYHPHVTLARRKTAEGTRATEQIVRGEAARRARRTQRSTEGSVAGIEWVAEEFLLYESRLGGRVRGAGAISADAAGRLTRMRIASFLPSATEILFAIGAGEDVVAVTFECDYPAEARTRAQVVHSHMLPGLAPAEIDRIVRETGAEGRSLYFADFEALERLAPELVIVQDLCHVCAIDSPTLARDVGRLGSQPQVLSLNGHSLEGVLRDIELVGEAAGRPEAARALMGRLRARIADVRARPKLHARPPRVLCLEWLDPLFQGGHWIPEMTLAAGGEPVLATPGEKSVRITWEVVADADPEIVVVMPCGYDLAATVEQFRAARGSFPAEWDGLTAVREGRVFAVNGTAYFSRPGPRLVDGLEVLDAVLNERGFEGLPEMAVVRLDL